MTQYTLQQTAFVFSLVSNAAASVSPGGDFPGAITAKFNEVTQQYPQYIGSGWSIAWGPEVTTDENIADNALMVVQGKDGSGNPVFIVATAGTNPQSQYDELDEDLALTMTTFAAGGQISTGTLNGLTNLVTMQSNGTTLQQFLDSNASSKATLVFTGHSLGGALTPALALAMGTSKWGNVYALPTAGPTPGDAKFVAAFTAKFPSASAGAPTSTWNRNVVNSLDVVPLAWTNLSKLSSLYPQIGPAPCVQVIQNRFIGLIPSPNPFVALPQTPFTGQFVPPPAPAPAPPPPPPAPICVTTNTVKYLCEALYQHSTGYVLALIPELQSAFPTLTLSAQACEEVGAWCAVHSTESNKAADAKRRA